MSVIFNQVVLFMLEERVDILLKLTQLMSIIVNKTNLAGQQNLVGRLRETTENAFHQLLLVASPNRQLNQQIE
jgi:hypothetical protein